jgi:hypothetical protein
MRIVMRTTMAGKPTFDRGHDGFGCLLQRSSMLRLNALQLAYLANES